MTVSNLIFLAAKATLLFLSSLVCLRFARVSAPAARHRICLIALLGSLAILPMMLLPEPPLTLHIPALNSATIVASAGTSRWPWTLFAKTQFAQAIWASGCALVTLRFLIGCAALLRLRRSATPLRPGVLLAGVSVPIVTGLFRPAILLPQNALDWPEQQFNAAIQHELAHLRRRDLWANFIGVVACAFYWFHPLAWVLARRLREEQESACDDAVLASGFDPTEYAEALVATARSAIGYPLLSCRMADRAGIKHRLARVLSAQSHLPKASRTLFAALLLVIAAVSLTGEERVYPVGRSITNPGVIRRVEPSYTEAASKAKIQGRVLLNMTIGSDGLARNITVEHGIDPGLDRNATAALRQWRFKPAEREGKPVAVEARVAVNFRLR